MEFTEHEVSVMKGIADEETLALLKKIFVDMPSANYVELTKNIVGLDKATRAKTEGKPTVHAPR